MVGGKDCHLLRAKYRIPEDEYGADIHFAGWIDQVDLPAVYSQAAIYLYPSNLEAFPIPITEAMACGTPIITSDVNGLREIAGDAALFVDPSEPATVSKALLRLTGCPQLCTELSKLGLRRAKLFDWEKCARQTLGILVEAATQEGTHATQGI